jgi:hypothetical protein
MLFGVAFLGGVCSEILKQCVKYSSSAFNAVFRGN